MPKAKVNNIEIEYETFGDPSSKPLLLIMGLGAQMIRWDVELIEKLGELSPDAEVISIYSRYNGYEDEISLEDATLYISKYGIVYIIPNRLDYKNYVNR